MKNKSMIVIGMAIATVGLLAIGNTASASALEWWRSISVSGYNGRSADAFAISATMDTAFPLYEYRSAYYKIGNLGWIEWAHCRREGKVHSIYPSSRYFNCAVVAPTVPITTTTLTYTFVVRVSASRTGYTPTPDTYYGDTRDFVTDIRGQL